MISWFFTLLIKVQTTNWMKKKIILIVFLLFTSVFVYSQNTITGAFSGLANQQVKLLGFNGFAAYAIDSVQADGKGVFKLSYNKQDFGMAYLKAEDEKNLCCTIGR